MQSGGLNSSQIQYRNEISVYKFDPHSSDLTLTLIDTSHHILTYLSYDALALFHSLPILNHIRSCNIRWWSPSEQFHYWPSLMLPWTVLPPQITICQNFSSPGRTKPNLSPILQLHSSIAFEQLILDPNSYNLENGHTKVLQRLFRDYSGRWSRQHSICKSQLLHRDSFWIRRRCRYSVLTSQLVGRVWKYR